MSQLSLPTKLTALSAVSLAALVLASGLGLVHAMADVAAARAVERRVGSSLAAAQAIRQVAVDVEIDADGDEAAAELGRSRPRDEALVSLDHVLSETGDRRIVGPLNAQQALTHAIRDLGREQSLVGVVDEQGAVEPRVYDELVLLAASQRVRFDQFEDTAPGDTQDSFTEAQSAPSNSALPRLREASLEAGPGGTVDASDAEAWAEAVDQRIELLDAVADEAATDLLATARARTDAARGQRRVAILLFVCAIGLAVGGLVLLRRSIRTLRTATRPPATSSQPHVVARRPERIVVAAPADRTIGGTDSPGAMYLQFGRRAQQLVTRQLSHIDDLEARTDNPDTLGDLFLLDHLTTRLRRNAESLVVLAGADSPRPWSRPVSVVNAVRAAVAETSDYTRVDIDPMPPGHIVGAAANEVSHLLAELIDNALAFSAAGSRVTIAGQDQPDGSYLVAVADQGVGLTDPDLLDANTQIARAARSEPPSPGSFGLYVVGRFAQRLGVLVRLVRTGPRGVTAKILLPPSIMTTAEVEASRSAVLGSAS